MQSFVSMLHEIGLAKSLRCDCLPVQRTGEKLYFISASIGHHSWMEGNGIHRAIMIHINQFPGCWLLAARRCATATLRKTTGTRGVGDWTGPQCQVQNREYMSPRDPKESAEESMYLYWYPIVPGSLSTIILGE